MGDACCGKAVEVQALQARQRRVLAAVMAINFLTFAMMVAAAWYSGSSSLLSGGLDNFGDALTYALSLAVVGAGARAKARVSMIKGLLILCAALAVAAQIAWRLTHPATPVFEAMGGAALLNLAANGVCLWLLAPHRHADINMASVWECSRNDVAEGLAVVATAALVGLFDSGWPDVIVATALLCLFLRSAWRILSASRRELRRAG